MEKEFIPYEQALALKELGFEYVSTIFAYDEVGELYTRSGIPHDFNIRGLLSAPTYSQAFRWFREKYNLHAEPYTVDMGAIEYCFQIRDLYSEKYVFDNFVGAGGSYHGTFSTYEQAELECLKKLIQITKNK